MCFDSYIALNSIDTALDECARHVLSSKQATSMANTIAIDSKQSRWAKPEGSPALLCAFGLHFWGAKDALFWPSVHKSSVLLPDGTSKLAKYKIIGTVSQFLSHFTDCRSAQATHLVMFWAKSGQAVSKNDVKRRFWAPLTPKMRKTSISAIFRYRSSGKPITTERSESLWYKCWYIKFKSIFASTYYLTHGTKPK